MNQTYAVSDIHGNYDLWLQVSNYCDSTDKIYFLGDAIDRGPDGIKILEDVIHDNRVTFIWGNHEELALTAVPRLIEIFKERILIREIYDFPYDDNDFNLQNWIINGGLDTIRELINDFHLSEYINILTTLSNQCKIKDIYINKNNKTIHLSHAGITFGKNRMKLPTELLLWDRDHISDQWSKLDAFKDCYVVHGHTGTDYVRKKLGLNGKFDEILIYSKGHKIDLDISSFITHRAALFNLDTFKVIYFEDKREVLK